MAEAADKRIQMAYQEADAKSLFLFLIQDVSRESQVRRHRIRTSKLLAGLALQPLDYYLESRCLRWARHVCHENGHGDGPSLQPKESVKNSARSFKGQTDGGVVGRGGKQLRGSARRERHKWAVAATRRRHRDARAARRAAREQANQQQGGYWN
jgi:hypothetical protein